MESGNSPSKSRNFALSVSSRGPTGVVFNAGGITNGDVGECDDDDDEGVFRTATR